MVLIERPSLFSILSTSCNPMRIFTGPNTRSKDFQILFGEVRLENWSKSLGFCKGQTSFSTILWNYFFTIWLPNMNCINILSLLTEHPTKGNLIGTFFFFCGNYVAQRCPYVVFRVIGHITSAIFAHYKWFLQYNFSFSMLFT